MPVTLRQEDVETLYTALTNGAETVESTLDTLQGQATENINSALEGTKTAPVWDEKTGELIKQLKETLPAFEQLGDFVRKWMEGFDEMDQGQADALA